ncbi:MAG: ComF family protein [Pseudomonadota bacterium]
MALQNPLKLLFPDQCVACGVPVQAPLGLCGSCWKDTPFLGPDVCDACGVPLLGQVDVGERPHCDACMIAPRAWARGRAALEYRDTARRIILGFKHGDRLDLAPAFAQWMARAGTPLFAPDLCLVPVPLHWRRRVMRRFNQSALLAQRLATIWGVDCAPEALVRTRATRAQERMTAAERAANLDHAIAPHPRHGAALKGRSVLLIDDVMTSGATFTAATEAALAAGAAHVSVLALARVALAGEGPYFGLERIPDAKR